MEWGDPSAPPVVCWHGLARTGRDFDELAIALAADYWVLCPDTPGRGWSQWLRGVPQDYCFQTYEAVAVSLCDELGIGRLRWVGTSMGGHLGMRLATGALKDRITHLVLNDIGPEVPDQAIERIVTYVGNPPAFDSLGELEQWLRTVYVPFGKNSDVFWRRMAETSARRTDSGQITVHYDPQLVRQFTEHSDDLDLWPTYDALRVPTLLLRGRDSDVLPESVAQAMVQRGPCPELCTFEGCGHAPTLASAEQQVPVSSFLAS
jgi:pimeloyl-ACP methyl ester carboxylesterase